MKEAGTDVGEDAERSDRAQLSAVDPVMSSVLTVGPLGGTGDCAASSSAAPPTSKTQARTSGAKSSGRRSQVIQLLNTKTRLYLNDFIFMYIST